MTDVESEIAALRAEVEQLRAEIAMMRQASEADGNFGGGEGCDVGLPLVPLGGGIDKGGAFRIEDGIIKDPHFQFGRRVYTVGQYYMPETLRSGLYYLKIDHGNIPAATVDQLGRNDATTISRTLIPLFEINNHGEVVTDYRGMPVIPVRE